MDNDSISRRGFVAGALGSAALAACGGSAPAPEDALKGDAAARAVNQLPIPKRALGRTGVDVSIVGVGGFHLAKGPTPEEATRIVRTALDRGINFLDNAWDYNGGESEVRMGAALADGYRIKAFVASKVDGHTAAAATAQLEQSLRRLRTDVIDLIQVHEVIRMNDPEEVFAPGGAIEGLVAARKAGKVRFIGFTGHKDPEIHVHMIREAEARGFQFDTVLMPINVMDAHYRSFEHGALPLAIEKGIGVTSMKPLGAGEILKTGKVTAVECLHYAMSRPVTTVITGCDRMSVLEQAVLAAASYQAPTQPWIDALLARTREDARSGERELFKTSDKHDSTAAHPQWLTQARI